MATDIGTGSTLTLGTSAYETGLEILNISWSGIAREAIDTTHMTTSTARSFIPSNLFDAGELVIECHLRQDTTPIISAVAETITITLPNGAGTSAWAAEGFLTAFEFTSPLEEKMTASLTFKFSGNITIS